MSISDTEKVLCCHDIDYNTNIKQGYRDDISLEIAYLLEKLQDCDSLILHSGSSSHIICNKSLFFNNSISRKITKIQWGK